MGMPNAQLYHNNLQIILSESNTVLSAQSHSVNQYVNLFPYRVLVVEQRVTKKKRIKKNMLMKNCAGIFTFSKLGNIKFCKCKSSEKS